MVKHPACSTLLLCLALIGRVLGQAPAGGREADAGEVTEGEVVKHTFTISGVPPGTSIERVEVDQAGLSARFRRQPDPAAAPQVRVEWDTGRAERLGPIEGHATVIWTDRAHAPVGLTIRATVRPVFSVGPSPALFFSVFQGETKTDRLTIDLADGMTAAIERLEPVGTHFTARLETREAGRRYEVVVTVPPDASPGRFRERVVLHTSHPTARTLVIPVNVLVKTDVYANPEAIEFGDLPLGALSRDPARQGMLTETVIVRRRQGPFSIRNVTCDVAGLAIARDPETGTSEAFRIDVRPDVSRLAPGASLNGTLTILTSDPRFPEIRVPVSGRVAP
jgi:hypothetical protein